MRREHLLSSSARTLYLSVVLVIGAFAPRPGPFTVDGSAPLQVAAVDTIGMTVSDMDRALAFYAGVLPFVKVSDYEMSGRPYELLTGVLTKRISCCASDTWSTRQPDHNGFRTGT